MKKKISSSVLVKGWKKTRNNCVFFLLLSIEACLIEACLIRWYQQDTTESLNNKLPGLK